MTETLIGRTDYGDRIYISARLELREPRNGMRTTDHRRVTEPFYMFGISGYGIEKGFRSSSFAGQIVDELRRVTRPAPRWTRLDILRLANLWDTWHLNDMRAACAHQAVVTETDRYGRTVPSLTLTQPCPITGYRYGRAWLVDILPADVETEIRAFIEKLGQFSPY